MIEPAKVYIDTKEEELKVNAADQDDMQSLLGHGISNPKFDQTATADADGSDDLMNASYFEHRVMPAN